MFVIHVLVLFLLLPLFILKSIIEVILPPKEKCVKNKIVLITGAANGLGRELARKFAELGSVLVLVDMKTDDLKLTEETIQKENNGKVEIHSFKCDIANREQVYKMAEEVLGTIGKVDILINNAGLLYPSNFTDGKEEHIERVVNVNILGQVWMTKAFLPSMQERNEGQIVFISSISAIIAIKGLNIYSMTKAALSGLAMSLKDELETNPKWNKIVVTSILPLVMHTNPLISEGVRSNIPIVNLNYSTNCATTAIRRNLYESAVPGYEFGIVFHYWLRTLPRNFLRLFLNATEMTFAKMRNPELATRYMSEESNINMVKEFGENFSQFFKYDED